MPGTYWKQLEPTNLPEAGTTGEVQVKKECRSGNIKQMKASFNRRKNTDKKSHKNTQDLPEQTHDNADNQQGLNDLPKEDITPGPDNKPADIPRRIVSSLLEVPSNVFRRLFKRKSTQPVSSPTDDQTPPNLDSIGSIDLNTTDEQTTTGNQTDYTICPIRDITDGMNVGYYIASLFSLYLIQELIQIIFSHKFVPPQPPNTEINQNGKYNVKKYVKYAAYIIFEEIKHNIVNKNKDFHRNIDKSDYKNQREYEQKLKDFFADGIFIHSKKSLYDINKLVFCTLDMVNLRAVWLTTHKKIERSVVVLPERGEFPRPVTLIPKSQDSLHVILNVMTVPFKKNKNDVVYPDNSSQSNNYKQDDDGTMLKLLKYIIFIYKTVIDAVIFDENLRVAKPLNIPPSEDIIRDYRRKELDTDNNYTEVSHLLTGDKLQDFLQINKLTTYATILNITHPRFAVRIQGNYLEFLNLPDPILRHAYEHSASRYAL